MGDALLCSGSLPFARRKSFLNALRLTLSILLLAAGQPFVAAQTGSVDQQALTNDSIVKMLRAGLSEEVILTSVEHEPGKYSLGVDEMIALRNSEFLRR